MEVKKIELDLVNHKDVNVVLIKFPYNNEIADCVRKIPLARWSVTHRSWYVPYSVEATHAIKRELGQICVIDAQRLKEKWRSMVKADEQQRYLANNHEKIARFTDWMHSRRYSTSTINTYVDALIAFLKFFYKKPVEEISNDDIVFFNNEFILRNNYSASYQNQVVNAVKLFFRHVVKRTIDVELIHRPKRQKTLPNVLSKEEVKMILEATQNIKHKTMLSLVYACGLRCGEILRLKPDHVDARRGVLFISQSKGKKDRIAPLSVKTIEIINEYRKAFPTKIYLFEGQNPGNPYDARSLQNVLKQNVHKAGITKPVSLHWLRHSYATHLLENGTDLRYIQEILGHSSSKTTEIYTHVSNKSIQKIVSPFDYL
jgi:integrase/recombinase XerD